VRDGVVIRWCIWMYALCEAHVAVHGFVERRVRMVEVVYPVDHWQGRYRACIVDCRSVILVQNSGGLHFQAFYECAQKLDIVFLAVCHRFGGFIVRFQ
jgi:hypothetical protein